MKIFHYHPDTGIYLGEGMADPSPLEPGQWLIPAYATSAAPPDAPDGQQAVMLRGAWRLQTIPAPMPEPEPEPKPEPADLTPEQKLAAAGLTVAELRELLGLDQISSPATLVADTQAN